MFLLNQKKSIFFTGIFRTITTNQHVSSIQSFLQRKNVLKLILKYKNRFNSKCAVIAAGDIFRSSHTDLINHPTNVLRLNSNSHSLLIQELLEHKYVTRKVGNISLCTTGEGAKLSLEQMHNLVNPLSSSIQDYYHSVQPPITPRSH